MEEKQVQQEYGSLDVNLSVQVVKSKLALDTTKIHGNYQQLIKVVLEADVTEENFEEGQILMKKISSILSFAEDHRKAEKKPYLEAGKAVDQAHNDFMKPLEEAKTNLQRKLNIVGQRIEAEALKAKQEQERIVRIREAINNFILDFSVKIASATTNEQLFQLERLVNLEKANSSKYQDHLPLLRERCNELTEKIKDQKALIKQREAIENDKKSALEAGDDRKAIELQEESEKLQSKIHDNTIQVQEVASKSVLTPEIVVPQVEFPSARRRNWRFELVDEKEAMKKSPDLLKVELDFKKVSDVLKTLRDSGVLNGKTEYVLNGIRYYEVKNF